MSAQVFSDILNAASAKKRIEWIKNVKPTVTRDSPSEPLRATLLGGQFTKDQLPDVLRACLFPMGSAPRDGSQILAFSAGDCPFLVSWETGYVSKPGWLTEANAPPDRELLCWMPLPRAEKARSPHRMRLRKPRR